MLSICPICLIPFPFSPSLKDFVPLRTNSAVGSYRVPNLSFSLMTSILLSSPSCLIGMKYIESPFVPGTDFPSWSTSQAKAKEMSESIAEVNHLYPKSSCSPSFSTARVSVAFATSDPPLFSVIHCPEVQNLAGSLEVRF